MACYDTIIGLSRNDCPCINEAPPEDYNTSDSGLYMDELEPLTSLQGFETCEAGSVWDILSQARDMGVSTFKADSNSLLLNYYEPRRQYFKGQIGEAKATQSLSTSDTYAGIRIRCNPIRDGVLRINKIGTLFSSAGTIEVKVYNSLNTLIATRTVNKAATGFTVNELATPIELPLSVDYDDNHEYYIVYTHSGGAPAKLNKINCGCGGFSPWFDIARPMWSSRQYSGGSAWANWIMVSGWTGDTLDFTDTPGATSNYLNGLFLDVDLGCDIGQVICKSNLDYTYDPLALTIAHSIRYISCYHVGQKLLSTVELNRQNIINREEIKARMKEWQEQYFQGLNYIAQNAKIDQNDCLVCRNKYGLAVKSVLV